MVSTPVIHAITWITTHYRPRRDGRLGWPGWLTHSGRLTHEVVTRQPWIRRRSGKVCQLQTDVLTTEPRRQPVLGVKGRNVLKFRGSLIFRFSRQRYRRIIRSPTYWRLLTLRRLRRTLTSLTRPRTRPTARVTQISSAAQLITRSCSEPVTEITRAMTSPP